MRESIKELLDDVVRNVKPLETAKNRWSLWVNERDIPECTRGRENVEKNRNYRVILKNTDGLNKNSPYWNHYWATTPSIDICGTDYRIGKDHGETVLFITLSDDAEVETWWGDEW